MNLLVTGGAGYIGSHTVVELLEAGHKVVVIDNLSNSSEQSLARVETITGKHPLFVKGDLRDRLLLDRLFRDHAIDAVIHFAGLKAVGESTHKPLDYYDNNVGGSLTLCQAMSDAGVFKMVFSSSATVYGAEADVPYVETMQPGQPTNPYGATKAIIEQVLTDVAKADDRWSIVLLRYFNPIGAHPSGLIGEDPKGVPNNLLPFITQVAVGKLRELAIFGKDYPTPDGTCIRDYLHVVDLAVGHLKALSSLSKPGSHVFNLGTGQGYSVMEMVRAFESVSGQNIPFSFVSRREGDLAAFWANANKAKLELGWQAEHGLEEMMRDAWNWQSSNPEGY